MMMMTRLQSRFLHSSLPRQSCGRADGRTLSTEGRPCAILCLYKTASFSSLTIRPIPHSLSSVVQDGPPAFTVASAVGEQLQQPLTLPPTVAIECWVVGRRDVDDADDDRGNYRSSGSSSGGVTKRLQVHLAIGVRYHRQHPCSLFHFAPICPYPICRPARPYRRNSFSLPFLSLSLSLEFSRSLVVSLLNGTMLQIETRERGRPCVRINH